MHKTTSPMNQPSPVGAKRLSLDAARREARRMHQPRWRRAASRFADGAVALGALAVLAAVALAAVAFLVAIVVQIAVDIPRWEIGLVVWAVMIAIAVGAVKSR